MILIWMTMYSHMTSFALTECCWTRLWSASSLWTLAYSLRLAVLIQICVGIQLLFFFLSFTQQIIDFLNILIFTAFTLHGNISALNKYLQQLSFPAVTFSYCDIPFITSIRHLSHNHKWNPYGLLSGSTKSAWLIFWGQWMFVITCMQKIIKIREVKYKL